MLKDLAALKASAINQVNEIVNKEVAFSAAERNIIFNEFKDKFKNKYNSIILISDTIKVINSSSQTAYLPFSWFVRLKPCIPFIEALLDYFELISKIKIETVLNDEILRKLPAKNYESLLSHIDKQNLDDFLSNNLTEVDKSKFYNFLRGDGWLDTTMKKGVQVLEGRKLNRGSSGVISSCVTKLSLLVQDTSGKLEQFIELLADNRNIRVLIESISFIDEVQVSTCTSSKNNTDGIIFARNKIYYGAPGTGKSHRIEEITKPHCRYTTVFHPDTQYGDFVGALKPVMINAEEKKQISYEFRPGPFTKALIDAINKPDRHVYLVIEELNRAPAAAVFGEVFQLLDRNMQGESQYKIEVSDPDMLFYIKENLKEPAKFNRLYLPSNLSILATMNSSDQSVMPMDTAFKRRWLFEYLPIDFTRACNSNFQLTFADGTKFEVPWKVFAEVVNDTLSSLQVPEDRLLGHRFVSDEELTTIEEANNTLKGKILVYLWDDVLRHGKRDVIFNTSEVGTFGQLSHQFGEGKAIFSDIFEAKLLEALNEAQKVQKVVADEQPE
ncbi:McrB family protein [Pseudoalteromonas aurantia]|uniref:ATPase dynein-related AAA domain-containing protein n=1 Tax=Pseudoalteromonas aurantia 208 TaxID=1314867 RepID=A0ABR9EFY5_9GAMM|nr:AAA family ATPase [Pseudoalteromonas aurantia]MBE0369896.1 hypothetical protein [Pseudoalteromonas aurantia 208]